MTRNEAIAIAKVMGWGDTDWRVDELLWPGTSMCLVLAKDLQSRMVDDGWRVQIWQHKDMPFPFKAKALGDSDVIRVCGKTEPAAITELFCKVYGIKED